LITPRICARVFNRNVFSTRGAFVSAVSHKIAQHLANAERPCVTTSFQADGVVLLHMIRRIRPDIPVLFVDTLHHFPETLAYRDELTERWGLNLKVLRAEQPRPGLWRESTDSCCARHKVQPLFRALESYDTWFTGLRRQQSPSRANLAEVESFTLPTGTTLRKVNPLALWSTREIWAYAKKHDIPLLSLYDEGYTSIGCEPCTSLPLDDANPRSGRWGGQKLECGIHLQVVSA
jgi:phosphoadenosine phosphosulfate reductase